ncbi:MAG: NADP-dependent malic enzyme [Thermoplasmata archaeon]|jgi:malate dehydrogenase (oxaloacetate-decarboxylating)|nr:NADP-dependent malic enzyme [Thermoplasmata archaeon]
METEGGEGSARGQIYSQMAVGYSKRYRGKIQTIPKVPIKELGDFSIWYTPGVAAVSMEIAKNSDLSYEMTWRWNSAAIITDGTRVLGLGNIGPYGAMPVMEGKALIFKYLGGVDAVPIPINVHEKDEIVRVVKALEPAFGGINLEDIESPKCFYLLEKLSSEMSIPVWHDDQLGTAGATLAGVFNAMKLTGRTPEKSKVVFIGSGAANIATVKLFKAAGFNLKNIIMVDSKGILHPERIDIDQLMKNNPWKYDLAIETNGERRKGGIPEAMEGADIIVAASTPGPGTIKGEWIRKMEKRAIVFALANPVPEIWPDEAKKYGAEIVATGRSDFPNQINNSLVFPGVFRGALDSRTRRISESMIIEASKELARFAEEKGINSDYIIPTMEEWEVFPRVASAIANKAVEEGLARIRLSKEDFYRHAKEIIGKNRELIEKLISLGYIEDIKR